MVGKILAGRYELLEKIGEGGMAQVYRGWDSLLRRTVAVKVLKEQMTGDSAFVQRFRREAQAAAGLSHPNIVNIYDVGEEQNIHFIVMEYLDGKNLKEYIREKGRLSAEEATSIACRIAEALVEAHAAGVIHRDIKPQNIVFLNNGQVKVADFGIAMATDGTTLTCTDKVIGSVHYFSPEQARGSPAGKRSDLYSLGVILYEMVTGQVPFSGESPVSVAMKHVQGPVIPPSQLVDDLPEPLERIILKAMQKDPAHRYLSAEEFLEDLLYFQKEGKAHALPASAINIDNEKTKEMKPIRNNEKDEDEEEEKEGEGRAKSKKNWRLILLIILLSAALITGFIIFYQNFLHVPEVTVPDVRTLSYEDAVEVLEEAGLTPNPEVQYVYDDVIPEGHVVKTVPYQGRVVRKNRQIDLYISKGPQNIQAPNLYLYTEEEARILLQELGLKVSWVREYNNEIPEGKVFKQVPRADAPVSPNEEMVVYVSLGHKPIVMASLVGRFKDEAVAYLEQEGLYPRLHYEAADKPAGVVVGQFPESGSSVQRGQPVDLVISSGPAPSTPSAPSEQPPPEDEREEETPDS